MEEKAYEWMLQHRDSLKQTSVDKSRKKKGIVEYMTESEMQVINFDSVKEDYVKKGRLKLSEVPSSNDALFLGKDGRVCFIEFKNGEIDSMKNLKVKLKIYDSILIFLDIIKEDLQYSRENIDYILVFNENKKHTTKHFSGKNMERLLRSEVNESDARSTITGILTEKSGKEYIQFDLEKYKGFIFREVHTYTRSQFERKFVKKHMEDNLLEGNV